MRQFYLNKAGKAVQGACRTCQNVYRAGRIQRCRAAFEGKTKEEIYAIYEKTYGATKTCSHCKEAKVPTKFQVSLSMETGLHNQCVICSVGNSQGNGGLRDFIFLPDKDGVKYDKKEACERCGGTNKLAVDHILPIAKGGTDCISNKQTLCVHCNSKKNDTIDCVVAPHQLCERYRSTDLDFTDIPGLSRALAKQVQEFRTAHIETATLATIRTTLAEYKKKHNLGHNLVRILDKIALLFHK